MCAPGLKIFRVDASPWRKNRWKKFITTGSHWNPFPAVRYTERPDVAATHLIGDTW